MVTRLGRNPRVCDRGRLNMTPCNPKIAFAAMGDEAPKETRLGEQLLCGRSVFNTLYLLKHKN